jgi:hypothetical protein
MFRMAGQTLLVNKGEILNKKLNAEFHVLNNFEPDFVGRKNDIEKLHKASEVFRIIGIFGIKSVGNQGL